MSISKDRARAERRRQVLDVLRRADGPMTVGEIAARLGRTPTGMGQLMSAIASAGDVQMVDKRKVRRANGNYVCVTRYVAATDGDGADAAEQKPTTADAERARRQRRRPCLGCGRQIQSTPAQRMCDACRKRAATGAGPQWEAA